MAPKKTDVYFEVLDVTPATATRWLEQNPNNRKVADRAVDAFARVMKAGGWQVNSQAIAFDPAGNLIDGQHRLWAIIQAGIPVRISVAHNISPDAVKTIDRGNVRSVAEVLRREGKVPYPKRVTQWSNGERALVTNSTSRGSVEETEEYYARNRRAVDFLLEAMPDSSPFKPQMIGAALVFALTRKRTLVEDFVVRMVSGAGLDVGSPALECREVLISSGNQRRSLALKVLRCLQAEARGESMKRRHVFANESTLHYWQDKRLHDKAAA